MCLINVGTETVVNFGLEVHSSLGACSPQEHRPLGVGCSVAGPTWVPFFSYPCAQRLPRNQELRTTWIHQATPSLKKSSPTIYLYATNSLRAGVTILNVCGTLCNYQVFGRNVLRPDPEGTDGAQKHLSCW